MEDLCSDQCFLVVVAATVVADVHWASVVVFLYSRSRILVPVPQAYFPGGKVCFEHSRVAALALVRLTIVLPDSGVSEALLGDAPADYIVLGMHAVLRNFAAVKGG